MPSTLLPPPVAIGLLEERPTKPPSPSPPLPLALTLDESLLLRSTLLLDELAALLLATLLLTGLLLNTLLLTALLLMALLLGAMRQVVMLAGGVYRPRPMVAGVKLSCRSTWHWLAGSSGHTQENEAPPDAPM